MSTKQSETVWRSRTGKTIHLDPDCSQLRDDPLPRSRDGLERAGFTVCLECKGVDFRRGPSGPSLADRIRAEVADD